MELPNTQPTLLLVGARGRMASLFKPVLSSANIQIIESDQGDIVSEEVLDNLDYLWLSVPMSEVVSVAKSFLNRIPTHTCICDINSVKGKLFELYKNYPNEVLSLHPMFGPFVESLQGQKLVVCRSAASSKGDLLLKAIENSGVLLRQSTAEEHDKVMALIQVLIHFNKMVVAKVLRDQEIPIEQTLEFTSPIYRLELSIIARMFGQSAELYSHIQSDNNYAPAIREHFVEVAQDLASSLANQDHSMIKDIFDQSSEYFQAFASENLNPINLKKSEEKN